jgi:hypothetical protein
MERGLWRSAIQCCETFDRGHSGQRAATSYGGNGAGGVLMLPGCGSSEPSRGFTQHDDHAAEGTVTVGVSGTGEHFEPGARSWLLSWARTAATFCSARKKTRPSAASGQRFHCRFWGNDTLDGGGEDDRLAGGDGNDVRLGGSAATATMRWRAIPASTR